MNLALLFVLLVLLLMNECMARVRLAWLKPIVLQKKRILRGFEAAGCEKQGAP
jgi:hypothetical protein